MKKCPRCSIIFHLDERMRCLYCDALLMTVDREEIGTMPAGQVTGIGRFKLANNIIKRILTEWQVENVGRMQFLVSSYFRTRTFHFVYSFSRNDHKRGQEYRRFLIQPVNIYSILVIPWVIYDVLDSFFFRFLYNGYCKKCGWKYIRRIQEEVHSPTECEYNQEYGAVIDSILSGKIAQAEAGFKRLAAEKVAVGKRSAYNDLCSRHHVTSSIFDVLCIWVSVCFLLGILVAMLFPKVVAWISSMSGEMSLK